MKLTTKKLQQIIREESANIGSGTPPDKEAKKTKEVDADEFADSLEKDIDFMKALKIEENRVSKRLKSIKEKKDLVAKRIISRI